MLTGGAGLENVGQWVEAGAVAFGGGGSLTPGAETGDYESISKLARELVGKASKRSAGNERDKIVELRRRAFCPGTA
jgi:2-dehydro-3-deoxyphosphogluconate aldolase/(4S)-4-hydroxy-2-oxoglutarate aldolase